MVKLTDKDSIFNELRKDIDDDILIENVPLFFTLEESVYIFSAAITALKYKHTLTIKIVNIPRKLHKTLIGPFERMYEGISNIFTINGQPTRCFYTRLMLEHAFTDYKHTIVEDEDDFTIIVTK